MENEKQRPQQHKQPEEREEEDEQREEGEDQGSPWPPPPPRSSHQHQIRREPTTTRSPLHPLPLYSPADSNTVSSISDSHGSSPHTLTPFRSVASTPAAALSTKSEHPAGETPVGTINGDLIEERKLGESRRRLRPDLWMSRRSEKETVVKRALLGFRVSALLCCLVSFSVMVADRNQGWALDSFYKYKEFRYSMAVNVIGFSYSFFQICDLAYQLGTGRRRSMHNLRHYLDFAFDQIVAYLLASSSSSASVRVDDWLSNWGRDKFPGMASASVSLSFVGFASFALCSLASGYLLCALRSM